MPTVTLSPVFKQKFFDNAGAPLAGGKLFSYLATTTTKAATYTDSTGGTPNANPVILNFRGEADVWIEPNKGYKFVLAPSTDTDPPTNPIWTEDNVKSLALLTIYGGVDSGVVNAYVISISLPQSAYTDGTFITFIPANTNTAASTINVNGLGPVAIVNLDGSALSPGEIATNIASQIIFRSGSFQLLNPTFANERGQFNMTAVDLVGTPTVVVSFAKYGRLVVLNVPLFTGTSNAVTNRLTGLPTRLQTFPGAITAKVGGVDATDNGVITYSAGAANIAATSNQISFLFKGGNWTAAGTKTIGGTMISYFVDTPYAVP